LYILAMTYKKNYIFLPSELTLHRSCLQIQIWFLVCCSVLNLNWIQKLRDQDHIPVKNWLYGTHKEFIFVLFCRTSFLANKSELLRTTSEVMPLIRIHVVKNHAILRGFVDQSPIIWLSRGPVRERTKSVSSGLPVESAIEIVVASRQPHRFII